jgi:hypothetical protein
MAITNDQELRAAVAGAIQDYWNRNLREEAKIHFPGE